MTRLFTFLAAFFVCATLSPAASAQTYKTDTRNRDSGYVMQRAWGEVDRTSGWCDGATTTPANIWSSAFVPAELKTTAEGLANRRAVRFISIFHGDSLVPTVPMCFRLGPDTGTTPVRGTLTCTGTAGSEQTNGTFLRGVGDGRAYIISEIATTATPVMFVRSSAGTVRYCVEVTWKS